MDVGGTKLVVVVVVKVVVDWSAEKSVEFFRPIG